MFYRELVPPESLRRVVLSFWEFAVPNSARAYQQEIFPDGCVSVVYIRNVAGGVHVAGLSGLYLESIAKPMTPGDIVWGMRLSPAALSAVLGKDPRVMIGKSLFDAEAYPGLIGGLTGEMMAAGDLESAVPVFSRKVEHIAARSDSSDDAV